MKKLKIPVLLCLFVAAVAAHGQKTRQTVRQDSAQALLRLDTGLHFNPERLKRGYVENPLENLSGRLPGVSVTSGAGDRMAALTGVRVRGTTSITGGNDPLVLIDGVPSDLETLSTVYPGDIEQFEVLKNAAETAQYGSRGASGVIVVTTKKGKSGQFRISYDGNVGLQLVSKRLEMLSAEEYKTTARQLNVPFVDGGANEDYLRYIERTGLLHSHHIALNGGTATSNYRASVAYREREMVVKNNSSNNFVAKIDLTQLALQDKLRIDFGLFTSAQQRSELFDEQKVFYGAAAQNPTYPLSEKKGGGWYTNPTASQIAAPQAMLKADNDVENQHLNAHVQLKYKLSDDLNISALGTYTNSTNQELQFYPTWIWAQGQAVRNQHHRKEWLANLALDFDRFWGAHRLTARALGEWQHSRQTEFGTLVKGFTNNGLGYHNLAAGSLRPYGGTRSDQQKSTLASALLSARYGLFNRYALSVSVRADGSSLVGENHTWGLFPSVSGEWDVKNEAFMRHIEAVNRLKFRIGYGESGNLGGISAYNALRRLVPVNVVPVNGAPVVTMNEARNYNPDLRWETRGTFNVGAEAALWDNRLVLTAEYYHAVTRDMLYEYEVPVPPFVYDKLLANNGSLVNDGWELGLGASLVRTRDWELDLNANLTVQRSRLRSLGGDYLGMQLTAPRITPLGGLGLGAGFHGGNNNVVYQIVGQPLGVFYLPKNTGLQQQADGSRRYGIADLDGNGHVNVEDGGDRYVAGQATPKVMLGSNIALRYKNFDFAVQINGAFGHKIFNATALAYMNMTSFPDYNVMREAPALHIKDQNITDYWLEKGDYVNVDYITLGWNVPLRSRAVRGLRLSCSVNNPFTFTAYSGLTPMINSHAVNASIGLDDKRSYPVYRTFSMGVNLQF